MSEFVMLACDYDDEKDYRWPEFYVSEKFDGQRAIYAPMFIGMKSTSLHFCNVTKDRVPTICTGFFSRHGKVIHVPPSWAEKVAEVLPDKNLIYDGELWLGRGQGTLQNLLSITRRSVNFVSWDKVTYQVFDCVHASEFFNGRQLDWGYANYGKHQLANVPFKERYARLKTYEYKPPVYLVDQSTCDSIEEVNLRLGMVLEQGGEGLIAKRKFSQYEYVRSRHAMKIKPVKYGEARIIDFIPGKGKYLGMLGSLTVADSAGRIFNLSGFTDAERQDNPYKIGQTVGYKYRDVTSSNIPKEARINRT